MTGFSFRCKDTGQKCGFFFQGATSKNEGFEVAEKHYAVAHMQGRPDLILADTAKIIYSKVVEK